MAAGCRLHYFLDHVRELLVSAPPALPALISLCTASMGLYHGPTSPMRMTLLRLAALGKSLVFPCVSGSRERHDSAFLVLGLIVGLGCIAAALFIMVEVFLNVSGAYSWAGISVFVQCLLIFVSAFVMRFGTMPSSDDVF